ncbi:CMGC/CDK protein kinase [Microdochium bolleyi]|uniref:CMGC/CDK protein kinase n=1 Tax=Microdochium bolleyi TaxID=196109 RepID=A0A136ITP3_9PEZI|nr:CMGC/CDK protein kinase [Microdochium bolleyi]
MAGNDTQWRQELTAIERYDHIQNMCAILEATTSTATPTHQSAFAIENDAYNNSNTREQYDSACLLKPNSDDPSAAHHGVPDEAGQLSGDAPGSPGITIGTYQDCHHVSGGVTSEVYRSRSVALKVIAETHILEPHNPQREAKILGLLEPPCIPLLETFRDQDQHFVLAMPFMPLSLEQLIEQRAPLSRQQLTAHFGSLFGALAHIHSKGIIHRDIKPSAVLLASPDGPAYLSDFGTAWHPQLSTTSEPADKKILDIGTGAYRAPEVLFGDKSYNAAIDIWGAGVMLTECARDPAKPIFESRAAHEDGNQLSLILSIFKTIGSPTPETWPQAKGFKTPPFEMYQSFPGRPWAELLEGVEEDVADLIKKMLQFESSTRPTAEQVSS